MSAVLASFLQPTARLCLALMCITYPLPGLLHAQTSFSDVHVAPYDGAPAITRHAASGLQAIKTEVNLVLVPVSVTDGMERLVTGLRQENFQIFEGKQQQQIRHFSSEDAPASVGIIVDTSRSMSDKMDRVQRAVADFCEVSNVDDEFFMIEFSDHPRLTTDFTNNPEDLEHDLMFTHVKGQTALLDAIHMGLTKMDSARYGKKALLIISDGGDNHSRYTEREIKAAAKESDVMIYSIGTFDRYVPTQEELLGPELLSDLSEPTGGRAFTLTDVNDMPAVAHRIGTELRTQYVLAYRPPGKAHDGKWHRIKVKLRLPPKVPFLRAHAKTGYYSLAK